MNRREFTKAAGICVTGLVMSNASHPFYDEKPQIAVTIDDFNLFGVSSEVARKRNNKLLSIFREHSGLKAAAFPVGRNLNSELGERLLLEWGEEGHMIGNHTYSHWFYPDRGFEEFSQDVLRLESLIKDMPGFTRLFRFPALKEGDTIEKRDRMRAFLKEHGYRMGYVTIDASDWYIDQRLRGRLALNPKADLGAYKDYYLNHIWDRANFYNDLSKKVLGRSVKHTLLIHHNLLNELFLSDVLGMFQSKRWRLINAQNAYTDPVFSVEEDILPAGESIIWALAKESGKFNDALRYPGEDSEYEKPKMDKLGL